MELIVGKWYTSSEWSDNSYIKYKSGELGKTIRGTDSYIKKSCKGATSWFGVNSMRAATIEELKKYLPKDYKFNEEIEYEIY